MAFKLRPAEPERCTKYHYHRVITESLMIPWLRLKSRYPSQCQCSFEKKATCVGSDYLACKKYAIKMTEFM